MGKHIKQKNDISCTDEICTILRGLLYRFTVDGTKKKNRICDSFALTVENSADFARASVREQSSVLSYTIAIRITQSG